MYQSGYHLTEQIDTTPLKLNLSFLTQTDFEAIQEENKSDMNETKVENEVIPDYNYLME